MARRSGSPGGATVRAAGHGDLTGRCALVVGVDRSPTSRAVLDEAAELGRRLGADLHVVHAVDLADLPVDPDAADWEQETARRLAQGAQAVDEALAGYPGAWRYLTLRGDPASALLRVADEVDALMIVVGVRTTGWRHLRDRLGEAALCDRVVGHGHRPVLLVGPPPAG